MANKYNVSYISAFDEGKGLPLDAFHEFITGPRDAANETLITLEKAYRCVPWLNRGINLRADSLSHVPWHLETVNGANLMEREEYQYLIEKLPRLLALTEKSLIKRGRAFWLIETNLVGKKPTPRYIPARSVKPVTDDEKGIVGWKIEWSNGTRQYSPDQIVYFYLENDDSEIEPDVAPAVVALEAAGLLYASNAVPARFYAGGFVPVSMIVMPANAQNEEIKRTESFFKRLATGMSKMFGVIGVRTGVDVKTVGHTLKDSITPEITAAARDDISVALGIPPTVLDSTSANYATASSEMIGYYINTVFPECDLIQSDINRQFLEPLGLLFIFDTDQHEIMQTIQLAQAGSVVQLTGVAPLTVDEGRAMLGYDEREEEEVPEPESGEMEPDEDEQEDEDSATVKAIIAEMRASRLQLERVMNNGQAYK